LCLSAFDTFHFIFAEFFKLFHNKLNNFFRTNKNLLCLKAKIITMNYGLAHTPPLGVIKQKLGQHCAL
jgi:hypothetical protein